METGSPELNTSATSGIGKMGSCHTRLIKGSGFRVLGLQSKKMKGFGAWAVGFRAQDVAFIDLRGTGNPGP